MYWLPSSRRLLRATLAACLGVAALIAAGAALGPVSDSRGWKAQKSPNPGGPGNDIFLYGVAATSPTNARVAGTSNHGAGTVDKTVIEHWNGANWTVVPSPYQGATANVLRTVAAVSASDAWAVGYAGNSHARTVIEHWNGKSWKFPSSADPAHANFLDGVDAKSAANAFAAGYATSSRDQTPIEHCC